MPYPDHDDHTHSDYAERTDPALVLQLRNHMRTAHGAGDGWAYGVGADLLNESHNANHKRDAHGVPFESDK